VSYRCPVCKTPLWKEPFLLRRLKCPRCGAEFRPTVPWAFVRVLLLLIVLLGLALFIIVYGQRQWLVLLFVVTVIGFFWYLSSLVNLEKIAHDLTVPEGPVNSEDLQLDLQNQSEEREEGISGSLFYAVDLIVLLLSVLFAIRLFQ
jgi:hypothetical protein